MTANIANSTSRIRRNEPENESDWGCTLKSLSYKRETPDLIHKNSVRLSPFAKDCENKGYDSGFKSSSKIIGISPGFLSDDSENRQECGSVFAECPFQQTRLKIRNCGQPKKRSGIQSGRSATGTAAREVFAPNRAQESRLGGWRNRQRKAIALTGKKVNGTGPRIGF